MEEEKLSFFLLEDLIWEYNEQILNGRHRGKYALSVRPPKYQGGETFILPMTEEEIKAMNPKDRGIGLSIVTRKVLASQLSPGSVIRSIPDFLEGMRLKEVVEELGIHGQVIYKEMEGRIYVILKGNPRAREVLTGTRYLNSNPKIVKFGLAKVNFFTAFKGTAVIALLFYGGGKVVDGTTLYFGEGDLKSSFFSEMPAEVTKLLVSAFFATLAGFGMAFFGAPIAVGIGTALVVGYLTDGLFEKFDEATGFKEAVRDATESLIQNLKKWWDSTKQSGHNDNYWRALPPLIAERRALLEGRRRREEVQFRRELFTNMLKPRGLLPYIAANLPTARADPLEGFTYQHSSRLRVSHHRNCVMYIA